MPDASRSRLAARARGYESGATGRMSKHGPSTEAFRGRSVAEDQVSDGGGAVRIVIGELDGLRLERALPDRDAQRRRGRESCGPNARPSSVAATRIEPASAGRNPTMTVRRRDPSIGSISRRA